MASDLSLLFTLRAQNQASPAIKTVQADVSKLKSSFGSDFGQMQSIANSALGSITSSLTNLTGQIPLVGNSLGGLVTSLGSVAEEGAASSGAFASLLASMGPVGIAAAGIAIEVGAVVVGLGLLAKAGETVVETFFGLAQSAAGFRGELFDLSQQTGVSVETLNALEISAGKTGGNIQSIAQSLVIFQGQIEKAQNDSSEMGKTFKELGISTDNTEQSFRDAIRSLAGMEEGFRQTNLAAELFGRRGGKQVLAILKETNGDIDSAVTKLGALADVTTEDARAADEFNDSYRDLQLLLRNSLGKEAIPIATDAIKELTKFIKENEGAIHFLGKAIELFGTGFVHGFILPITDGLQIFNLFVQSTVRAIPGAEALARAYERIAGASERIKPLPGGEVTGGVTGETFGSQVRAGVEGVELPAQTRTRVGRARLISETDEERLAKQRIELVLKLVEAQRSLKDQLQGINVETHKYAVETSILNGVLRDASAAEQEQALRSATKLDNLETTLRLQKELIAFQKQQNEAVALAIDGEKSHLQVAQDLVESIQRQGGVLKDATIFWLQLKASILDTKEATRGVIEAFDDLKLPDNFDPNKIPIQDVPEPPPALAQFKALSQEVIVGVDAMRDAFASLGNALGQVIESFVLLGNSGTSLRKFTAQVLAAVAAQAAVKAVFELAEGFAALFLNPAEAAAHFTAAALYGSIAGITAAVGRGVAGNEFKKDVGRTSSSSGGSRDALDTIIQGRNQRQTPVVHIDIKHEEGVIVRTWADDYNNGGVTRETIGNDGR